MFRLRSDTVIVRAELVQRLGGSLLRWSLVFLLVFFGALKWTAAEAEAIRPLVIHSPALWWLDSLLGAQRASEAIGVIELTTAVLLAMRWWAPRLALIGGLLGVITFIITLSVLATTPEAGPMVPFLLKDVTLLGASVWLTGEAWAAAGAPLIRAREPQRA